MKLKDILIENSVSFPDHGKPNKVYRGITDDEYQAILHTGVIKTTGKYSHSSEGTSFTFDPEIAKSTVTFGRDNPEKTGSPVYVLEIENNDNIEVDNRDHWPKSKMDQGNRVPIDSKYITYVWRFNPDNSITDGKFPL